MTRVDSNMTSPDLAHQRLTLDETYLQLPAFDERSSRRASTSNQSVPAAANESTLVPPPRWSSIYPHSHHAYSASSMGHDSTTHLIGSSSHTDLSSCEYHPLLQMARTQHVHGPDHDHDHWRTSYVESDTSSILPAYTSRRPLSSYYSNQFYEDERYLNIMPWEYKDEPDDAIHCQSPLLSRSQKARRKWWVTISKWQVVQCAVLAVFICAFVAFFVVYPVSSAMSQLLKSSKGSTYGWLLGHTNSSGQIPELAIRSGLIDSDTPTDVMSKTGYDGNEYTLVFSDEFNLDGRTFYPDPYWEAVDLQYWPTGDLEYYHPSAITTSNGSLVITLSEESMGGMNYTSGMLQSWNKFCFTGGIVEVAIQLPGTPTVNGLWPGAWTMGNLGRAGYGATTDGTWSYTYDSCDVGAYPNQTYVNGTGPDAALLNPKKTGQLSSLPGQKLSACTCPGEEHPGPDVTVGRGAPEIDILEAEATKNPNTKTTVGAVSQSAQIAPFDAGYYIVNTTLATTVYDGNLTWLNSYHGGSYQEAASAVTETDQTAYQQTGQNFATYSVEIEPGSSDDSHITWGASGEKTWTMTAASIAANEATQVSQRLVTVEPMYMILNLGMSQGFKSFDVADLTLPGIMKVDYVRVYQRAGQTNVGCDPASHPTMDYIKDHAAAYTTWNYTTWEEAGYTKPKQSYETGGC